MVDTRAVRQELQEQLISAARKGQEQAKKARAQARSAEAQVRKSQDAVSGVVKTLTDTAEALRPQLSTVRIKLASLPGASRLTGGVTLPGGVKVPSAGALLAGAQETAEHMLAAQRKLADQIAQAAAPLLAHGAARAAQAAQAILPGGPSSTRPAADGHAPAPWDTAVTPEEPPAASDGTATAKPASVSTAGTSDTAKATPSGPAYLRRASPDGAWAVRPAPTIA